MKSCFDVKKEPAHITKNTPEEVILTLASECKNCGKCCHRGSGFLIGDDTKNIAAYLGISEEKLKKEHLEEVRLFGKTRFRPKTKKSGECRFFDKEKKCTINPVKPYQCKISIHNQHSKQINDWFMLNFCLDTSNKTAINDWLSRAKFTGTIPGGRKEDFDKNQGDKK